MGVQRISSWAGIAGPLVFVVLVAVQYVLKPDFDVLAWPISALAVGDLGWIQSLNFAVTALLLGTAAAMLRPFLGEGNIPVVAVVLLTMAGFGLLFPAIFPLEAVNGSYDPEADPGIHGLGPVVIFPAAGIGTILASVALRRRQETRQLGTITLAMGIAVIAAFGLIGAFAREPGMPLNPVFGLLQMVVVIGWMGAVLLMARQRVSSAAGP